MQSPKATLEGQHAKIQHSNYFGHLYVSALWSGVDLRVDIE